MLLSQVNVKGILLKSVDNFKKGDTVVVNACHSNNNYVVKLIVMTG
ncbi:MAG: hypothetical protein HC830_09055 [Bacteroidetes bacterium]|nr:hypothetical protein [Bacteroidota bacterium]